MTASIATPSPISAFLDAQAATNKKKKAGVQGYCMGGPLSFRTAAAVPGRSARSAASMAGRLTNDSRTARICSSPRPMRAVSGRVAKNDDARDRQGQGHRSRRPSPPPGGRATVEVYAGDHGWCVPGSQAYAHGSGREGVGLS